MADAADERTFVADPKFVDVVRELKERGYRSLPLWSERGSVSWRNLAKTRFESSFDVVNHLAHSQRLSHKGTLARLWFDDTESFFPRCYDLRDERHCEAFLREAGLRVARGRLAKALNDWTETEDDPELLALLDICEMKENIEVGGISWRRAFGHESLLEEENEDSKKRGGSLNLRERACRVLLREKKEPVNSGAYVLKPAGGSCGVGITCSKSLRTILEAAKAADFKVVVQQYIERPLLVRGRKFDVRQWLIMTHVDACRVYGYSRNYARFASEKWSLDSLQDRFAHLCNYSVQKDNVSSIKYADGFAPFSGNMWTDNDLAKFLHETRRPRAYEEIIKPQLKDLAKHVAKVAQRAGLRKTSPKAFEWLGIDLIIDEDLRLWLLEINVSPDVSHSTPVTADLLPQATKDALNLILDDHGLRQTTTEDTTQQNPRKDEGNWDLWYEEDNNEATQLPQDTFSYAAPEVISAFWHNLQARAFPNKNKIYHDRTDDDDDEEKNKREEDSSSSEDDEI